MAPITLYQTARVITLATEELASSSCAGESSKLEKVDRGVLSRIQKSLQLAKHPGTGEAEARQALRLATRLMASQNLTQANLIAAEDSESQQARAGLSEVEITSTTSSMVRNERWTNCLAVAINLFFSVKAYSTSHIGRQRLTWTFYGLAENTVAAATAFEMVHNQILTWSSQNRELKGRSAKNSYCHGVAVGLISMAKSEKRQELKKAIVAEKARLIEQSKREQDDQKKKTDRLKGLPVSHPNSARDPRVTIVQDEKEADHHQSTNEARQGTETNPDTKRIKRSLSSQQLKLEEEEREVDNLLSNRRENGDADPPFGHGYNSWNDEGGDGDDDHDPFSTQDYLGLGDTDIKPDFEEENEPDVIDLTQDSDEDQDIKPNMVDLSAKQESQDKEPQTKFKVKPESENEVDQPQWRDSGQLIRFRQDAEKIADEFLQRTRGKLKLRKLQSAGFKKDEKAFEQGRQDAKKIDVRRKRIAV